MNNIYKCFVNKVVVVLSVASRRESRSRLQEYLPSPQDVIGRRRADAHVYGCRRNWSVSQYCAFATIKKTSLLFYYAAMRMRACALVKYGKTKSMCASYVFWQRLSYLNLFLCYFMYYLGMLLQSEPREIQPQNHVVQIIITYARKLNIWVGLVLLWKHLPTTLGMILS